MIERDKARIRQERYTSLVTEGRAARVAAPLEALLTAADLDEIALGGDSPAAGRSLREIDLRGRTGASVVAVTRDGDLSGNPDPDFRLCAGDVLWVWGQPEQTEAAHKLLKTEARSADTSQDRP